MMEQVRNLVRVVVTLALALVMGGIIVKLSGKDALNAYKVLYDSSFGDARALANTLLAATPLIFTGLATLVAFRAGIFNIGVEGSLYVGAFAAAWVGFTFLALPGYLIILLAFLFSGLIGGIWGFIPGYLKARLRVDEVVSTIMLNYVAMIFTDYLVNGPFLLEGVANAVSAEIAPQARLMPLIPKSQWNSSFFIAIALVFIVFFLLRRTTLGYEINSIGTNKTFSRWSGMPVGKIIVLVMIISGFIGGLAGAGQVLGVHYRFIAYFSRGFGFDGIVVTLLGRNTPFGALISAIFLGALRSGGSTMELFTRIPRDLIDILQALIILFVAIDLSVSWFRSRRRPKEQQPKPAVT